MMNNTTVMNGKASPVSIGGFTANNNRVTIEVSGYHADLGLSLNATTSKSKAKGTLATLQRKLNELAYRAFSCFSDFFSQVITLADQLGVIMVPSTKDDTLKTLYWDTVYRIRKAQGAA